MKSVPHGEITALVQQFLRDGSSRGMCRRRERSWDFCYNHFQEHPDPAKTIELSSLHLGYYLASWGMLRGSSFLFRETNLMHYRPAIEAVEKHNPALRGVDAHKYDEPGIPEAINSAWDDLKAVLLPHGGRATTLVSKVMLGVWGALPSYDTYFMSTFQSLAETRAERLVFTRGVTNESYTILAGFYSEHAQEIEALRHQLPTVDFTTGRLTKRPMTRAKVIDIFGFQRSYLPARTE